MLKVFQAQHYYCPWDHKETWLSEKKDYVVFIGHAEDDLRIPAISRLVYGGHQVKIFGSRAGWKKLLPRNIYKALPPISPVYGHEYVKAVHSSMACLAFHSSMNQDDHSIRCFEIPACGSLLVAQDTVKMRELYKPYEDIFHSSMI